MKGEGVRERVVDVHTEVQVASHASNQIIFENRI
jgi:hypothetical protein